MFLRIPKYSLVNHSLISRKISFSSWIPTNPEKPKYSSNNDEDDFYCWIEKIVVPFPIICNDFRAIELRMILYEALNSPPTKYYYFNELWAEEYIKYHFKNVPIQDLCESKKLFTKHVKIINLLGKDRLTEYYKNNHQHFLINRE